MKIIIYVFYDRHSDYSIKVFPYSVENENKVRQMAKVAHAGGTSEECPNCPDYFGELDECYGWSESYFAGFSVKEVEEEI